MRQIKLIFLIAVIANTTNTFSQTGKYWCDYWGLYYSFNFQNSLALNPNKINYFPKVESGLYSQFTYSSFNGDLLFLGGQYRIFDHKGYPIKNSEKVFIPEKSIGIQTGDNSWDVVGSLFIDTAFQTGPYKYFQSVNDNFCAYNNCFDSLRYYPFGFYRSEIKRDSNNVAYINKKMQLLSVNLPATKIYFFDIKRTNDYNYFLLGIRPQYNFKTLDNNSICIYNFSFNNSGLRVLDSMVVNAYDYLPDSLKLRAAQFGSDISIGFAKLTRNRDKIFANILIQVKGAPLPFLSQAYDKEILLEINLNPVTGRILPTLNIVFDKLNPKIFNFFKVTDTVISYNSLYTPSNDPYSPNDSILYLNRSIQNYKNGTLTEINQSIIAWNFRNEKLQNAKSIFLKKEVNQNPSKFIFSKPNINPYGGLTIVYRDYLTSTNNFYHIQDANYPFSSISKNQSFSFSDPTYLGSIKDITFHNYDYLRIKDSILYKDCGAYVTIKNKSDLSNGLSDFKWYVSKNTKWTQWDSFSTIDLPTQYITKSGKYLFKLHGTSFKGNGYKEWYIDTIIIKIPPKPIAAFYAKDSVVCRFTSLQFNNYSNAKDTLNNIFLWSFGDGFTSNVKNPIYTYTKPGLYTVSLFYRNGYCDSTLTKNQYIRVVDAPKPGFSVQFKQGCSPFNANFLDTVTLNVKQKDYYFSDNKLWQNISLSTSKFTHVFNEPGVYSAIQRLSGFTGCIIQRDSVIFNISKGISKSDTGNIVNSTVENKNAFVYWNKIDGAISYQLFKDGNPYIQLKDTFFNEAIPYSKDAIYTVAGIDSCGTYSSIGRIGKPIFLQGNLIGNNEASIILFSPYMQWIGTDINYKIQKLINGNWTLVNSQKTNNSFTDNQFLNMKELQACYRIEAYESSQLSIISHSNELCIPYIPTIFIPTAFSPNDDLINDVFDVTCFGIPKYNLTVYNRWGQIVFKGSDNEAWNGGNASEGVYLVRIEYTTNLGVKLNQRVNVTLLK